MKIIVLLVASLITIVACSKDAKIPDTEEKEHRIVYEIDLGGSFFDIKYENGENQKGEFINTDKNHKIGLGVTLGDRTKIILKAKDKPKSNYIIKILLDGIEVKKVVSTPNQMETIVEYIFSKDPYPNLLSSNIILDRQLYGNNEQIYFNPIVYLDNYTGSFDLKCQYSNNSTTFTYLGSEYGGRKVKYAWASNVTSNIKDKSLEVLFHVKGIDKPNFSSSKSFLVFENRRIDYLMDVLNPSLLKNTVMERIDSKGNDLNNTIYLTRDNFIIENRDRELYKLMKESNFGSFAGLFGYSKIFGNNKIDSVIVEHGNMRDGSLNAERVLSDITTVYKNFKLSSVGNIKTGDTYKYILSNDKIIFTVHRNGPDIFTVIKRL